jgi:hypothetical protein
LAPGRDVFKIGEEFVAALGVSGAPSGEKNEARAQVLFPATKARIAVERLREIVYSTPSRYDRPGFQ